MKYYQRFFLFIIYYKLKIIFSVVFFIFYELRQKMHENEIAVKYQN